jgi:EAL domain-containing protein (putative c-di-GMP-specific phosphodiesterase class I)
VIHLPSSSESNTTIRQTAHRMFAEFAADVAFVVSDAGIVEHATRGAESLLSGGLIGRNVFTLVDAGSHVGLQDAMRKAFAGEPAETLMAVHAENGAQLLMHARVFLDFESRKLWVVAFDLSKASTRSLTPAYPAEREAAMQRALREGEFVVHYQPIVLRDGSINGCEALVRWRQPGGSFVSPADFIPLAERTGIIVELGEYVMKEALQQLKRFDAAGLEGLYMSVNVSPRQLEHAELEAAVARALAGADVSPTRLALEVTEGLSVSDPSRTRALLNRIAATGVQIALDDYGTGYAGMSYLKNFKVSTVKIDRSFVQELEEDDSAGILLKAFVEMTKKLGLKTIAEGVETPMQAQYLRSMNVDLFQGYLFGRPMAPEALIEQFCAPGTAAAA